MWVGRADGVVSTRTRTLLHQNQAQLLTYDYSAYGQTVASTGGETYDNRIRYTGGYLDTDTGLYKLTSRSTVDPG